MYRFILETQSFAIGFIEKEIKGFVGKNAELLFFDDKYVSLSFKDKSLMISSIMNIFYYSRLVSNIYMVYDEGVKELLDFVDKDSDFSLDVFEIDIDGEKVKVFDVIGFDLMKRDFMVNVFPMHKSALLVNYCFYLLGLDSEKKGFSVLCNNSEYGDVIIESSMFNPRKPLFVKKRNDILFSKIFNDGGKIPMPVKDKNDYRAIVDDDNVFRKLKENINYSSQKIKISKFDLDWFDVKYHKGDFDYVLCNMPIFDDILYKEEYESKFFYQAEFICKKKILVIANDKINERNVKKNGLKIEHFEEILCSDIKNCTLEGKYYVYIISKK